MGKITCLEGARREKGWGAWVYSGAICSGWMTSAAPQTQTGGSPQRTKMAERPAVRKEEPGPEASTGCPFLLCAWASWLALGSGSLCLRHPLT